MIGNRIRNFRSGPAPPVGRFPPANRTPIASAELISMGTDSAFDLRYRAYCHATVMWIVTPRRMVYHANRCGAMAMIWVIEGVAAF